MFRSESKERTFNLNLEYIVLLISLLALLYRRVLRRRRIRMVPNWVLITSHRKKTMYRSLHNNLPDNIIRFQARSFRCALERTNSYTQIYLRDLAWYWATKSMYWWLNTRTMPYRLIGKTHEEAGEIIMREWSEAAAKKERKTRWKTFTRR